MCDDDRKEILREENVEQYTGAVDLRFTRIEVPSPPSRSNHIPTWRFLIRELKSDTDVETDMINSGDWF